MDPCCSQFNSVADTGKSGLWHIRGKLLTLEFNIFVYNSIIEIYSNGVFCLITKIDPVADDVDESGYLAKGGSADYGKVMICNGLIRAWLNRPLNSTIHIQQCRGLEQLYVPVR